MPIDEIRRLLETNRGACFRLNAICAEYCHAYSRIGARRAIGLGLSFELGLANSIVLRLMYLSIYIVAGIPESELGMQRKLLTGGVHDSNYE